MTRNVKEIGRVAEIQRYGASVAVDSRRVRAMRPHIEPALDNGSHQPPDEHPEHRRVNNHCRAESNTAPASTGAHRVNNAVVRRDEIRVGVEHRLMVPRDSVPRYLDLLTADRTMRL